MNMILATPSTIILPEASDKVKEFLTYSDASIQYQIKELSKKHHWKRNDPEAFDARMSELKSQAYKSLLKYDANDSPYTYAGLWHELGEEFGWTISGEFECQPPKHMIPWSHKPEHEIRYYQDDAAEALLANAHRGPVAIELPTGSGKSRIIEEICKRNPVQTTIVTPSKNVTNQLFREMQWLFGSKLVGKYGDGKHDIHKLFTVCTAQALMRIEQGSEEWEFFSECQQFVWDESHTTPANTFDAVELGLLRNVPYRFHVSATQMRHDGQDMKLRGIIGPIVYKKEFKELVDEGFLARPYFKVFNVAAYGLANNRDIAREQREQLYLNPNVNRLAAEFAIKSIALANRPTLILLDEFVQFAALRPYLGSIPFEFCHGGANGEDKKGTKVRDILPREFWESDVEGAVDRFNRGEKKLLVGTKAISTGVDTKPAGCVINLQGGLSEVATKQAIGRGTRVTETKKDVIVVDFRVVGSSAMERHADTRVEIYKTMGDVQEITK